MMRFPEIFTIKNEFCGLFRMVETEPALEDENIDPLSITGIIKSEPRFSKFYRILQMSRFDKALAKLNLEQNKFTLFIPNNDAILFNQTLFSSDFNMAKAIFITEACIINGAVEYESFKNLIGLKLLTPYVLNNLSISLQNNEFFVNNIMVIKNSERVASNGVIHELVEFIDPTNRG